MLRFVDGVLGNGFMRVAYGVGLVATLVFIQAVALPADTTWLLRAALVAACTLLAMLFLWVTVGPTAREPLLLRTAGLAVISAACGLTLAGFGAFDAPRREFETPTEIESLNDTADVLRTSGYPEASVTYPTNTSDTILVRFAGGPPIDQPGAADDIAGIVWTHEGVRFRMLLIEASGTSVRFSYEDLARRFPPRPSGLDSVGIDQLRELAQFGPALLEGLDDVGREAIHAGAFLGAGLLALIGLVATSWTAVRRFVLSVRVRY